MSPGWCNRSAAPRSAAPRSHCGPSVKCIMCICLPISSCAGVFKPCAVISFCVWFLCLFCVSCSFPRSAPGSTDAPRRRGGTGGGGGGGVSPGWCNRPAGKVVVLGDRHGRVANPAAKSSSPGEQTRPILDSPPPFHHGTHPREQGV